MKFITLLAASAIMLAGQAMAKEAKPLFQSTDVLRLTFKGPVGSTSDAPRVGTITVGSDVLPITFTPRGITRRKRDTCQFPPLRVTFTQPPAAGSIFAKQKRLKLVTHCRSSNDFQQHVLLEYAAYQLYRQLTPLSFGARLAMIDYVGDNGRPITSRYGFFIEDTDDMAKRNEVKEPKTADRLPVSLLSPQHAGRFAMFQHMLGNHDWSMRAGPQGAGCCHNGKLVGPVAGSKQYAPVPYDFDFSGLVDAPYAAPPEQVPIDDVRTRYYRGYCVHNLQALQAAADMRATRGNLLATLASTPGLDSRASSRATSYLERFFADIASDESTKAKVLKNCL